MHDLATPEGRRAFINSKDWEIYPCLRCGDEKKIAASAIPKSGTHFCNVCFYKGIRPTVKCWFTPELIAKHHREGLLFSCTT